MTVQDDPVKQATEALEADRKTRMERFGKALQELIEKERCNIVPVMILTGGNVPMVRIEIHPQ